MSVLQRAPARLLGPAAAAALTVACQTTPPELVNTRTTFDGVAADPAVEAQAPVELYEARQAVERAENEWNKNGHVEETVHLAWLASRRTEIAQIAARRRNLEGQMETAGASREKVIHSRERAALDELVTELRGRRTDRGVIVTLGGSDFASDGLGSSGMRALYRLVTFLRQNPDRWIQVDAFSVTGDLPAQRENAQRRADDVKSFLVENGVNGGRILALGYDSRLALEDDAEPERVEITVLRSGVRPARRAEPV